MCYIYQPQHLGIFQHDFLFQLRFIDIIIQNNKHSKRQSIVIMDSYSSTSNTDSSASYSFSSNSSTHQFPHQERNSGRPPAAFRSAAALHSIRKHPSKTTIAKKMHIAPLPPTPPKVYKVDPIEFKDVVQKLTGAIEFQPRRLREAAPPPLSLSPSPHRNNFAQYSALKPVPEKTFDGSFGGLSPLGFSLSPSSVAWCKAMLLSPGTIASFEPSLVL